MTSCCNNRKEIEDIEAEAEQLEKAVDSFIKWETTKCKRDSLELIFSKQKDLLDHLNEQKPDNYYNAGPERYPFEKVMHMITAMSDEFSEVRAGLKWKYWKSYSEDEEELEGGEDDSAPNLPDLKATQKQIRENSKLSYLRDEWIDILHFWVQGAMELGMDAKTVLDLYLDKNSENSRRYENGY